ncbi:MAG: lipopolysaccharide transport periplasmic protein LptA [Nitrospinae bacterium]|nr:lipopolysaccharide transport periplasmic protein LptA [Nitrospinota bacterium]
MALAALIGAMAQNAYAVSGDKGTAQTAKEEAEDKKAPLQVTSERMLSDNKNNTISFFGSVVAIKGKLKVEADEMRVLSYENQNEMREMEATGSVKITHKDKVAVGEKANYYADSRTLVLTGNPVLTQGKNVARGEKVVYYFNREDMEIFSGDRTQATIILFQKEEDESKSQKQSAAESGAKK